MIINYDNDNDINPLLELTMDSLFYDSESFCKRFRNSDKPVFLNLNVQSLTSKHEKLKDFIVRLTNKGVQIDLIALQETWNIKYANLIPIPGFQKLVFKNRLTGRGGGVGFYIREGIHYKIIENVAGWQDKLFESISLKLTYTSNKGTKNFLVSSCYRSPTSVNGYTLNQQYEIFINKLDILLNELSAANIDSYVFLDSNINLLDLQSNDNSRHYLNTIIDRGFIPANMKASRMHGNSSTLIDHILTNSKLTKLVSGSIIEDISDHWITFLQPCISKYKSKPKAVKSRHLNTENLEKFKANLSNVNWEEVTTCNNVDDCYNAFWTLYSSLFDIHFPLTTTNFNRNIHKISNFMTKGLLISRKTKISLLKSSLIDPTQLNKDNYRRYRNLYNTLLRTSKKMHIDSKLKRDSKNPKKIWDTIKEFTTGKSSNQTINKINSQLNLLLTDQTQIAEEFNTFFAGAGHKVANSIDPVNIDPMDYLKNKPPSPEMYINEISQGEFINIIEQMEPKSSLDLNGISTKIIKFVKYELATPLVYLFNLSIRTGKFPAKLKTSRTVPVFKSGDPLSCDNYRPISLLSSISKILEKFVSNQLVNHLEYNKLLYEHQYGFQRGKSTVHNLTHLTNFVSRELNEKKFVIGVFLDLKKAFDVVNHEILLKKLKKLGLNGVVLEWFTSYLEGRSQCVDINGHLSKEISIDISVLQGSILGPLLFLCFINDLPTITNLLTLLFADDTAGLKSGFNLDELITEVNIELNKLAIWFRANKMAVNVSKTKYIIFKPKGMKINIEPDKGIVYDENEMGMPRNESKITPLVRIYNDNPDPCNRTYKLLGLYLDEHLSFDYHCDHVRTKIAQSNFIISRAKHFLPKKTLKTLYYALVHPHLLYCLPIYSCTSAKNLTKLELIQKKTIRTITNSNYTAHTTPLFNDLKIMPFKHLITYTQSLLVHSIYHKYCPPSLHNTWITNSMRNDARDFRNADDLYVPYARTEHVKKMSYFTLPRVWNELSEQKFTPNPTTFKIAIKHHFLSLDQSN